MSVHWPLGNKKLAGRLNTNHTGICPSCMGNIPILRWEILAICSAEQLGKISRLKQYIYV